MTDTQAVVKVCGAKTRRGGRCKLPAGWGTDHAATRTVPGVGRCKLHGGSVPNARKGAKREQALNFARGQLGAAVSASPLEAMEQAVQLTVGLVAYYRHEIADAFVADDERALATLRPLYVEALKLEKDVAAAGLSANVAERRVRIAEDYAEWLAGAAQQGLGALARALGQELPAAAVMAFRDAFAAAVEVVESSAEDDTPALGTGVDG